MRQAASALWLWIPDNRFAISGMTVLLESAVPTIAGTGIAERRASLYTRYKLHSRAMPAPILRVATAIDRLNGAIGRVAAWGILAMALIQCVVIIMRLFGAGSLWLHESLFYFHIALVLFTAAWTLRQDGHVRVDIIYSSASPRTRAAVDLAGSVLLLMPFMLAIIAFTWPYALRSLAILEGSREAGGLPLVYLLKAAILLFAAQMLLQGLSRAIRVADALASRAPAAEPAA
jgi:TRAP-type mannitol/chloroaromatic compound transport system permease small subunit